MAMSDEDDLLQEHWPLLTSPERHDAQVTEARTPSPTPRASSAAKRPINHASDSSAESSSPAAKTIKRKESSGSEQRVPAQPTDAVRNSLSLNALPPPAFAPRSDYVKLLFKDNPSVDIKLRWLSEVTRTFHLDRDLAEVKMAAITSRFVYISRSRSDIVDSVTKGEIVSLFLEIQDSPERPRKYPTYLITRYPVCTDPALAKELPGIYTARRFYQNGTPINRLVVTWSLPHPPPHSIAFSFLPCLPACEFRRMKDEQPWCYRCWKSGHISRYCSALERCAYCSESHDSRTCPHRPPPPVPASDSATMEPQPTPPDTSRWKCPRCHEPGVNAWHPGCARRRANAAPTTATRRTTGAIQPPPPPPHSASPPASNINAESTQVTELREAVATLKTRVASLSARFDGIEAHLNSFISKQATFEAKLNTLVESHQVVVSSINCLTQKLDTVASSLETLTAPPVKSPPRGVAATGARITTHSSSRRRSSQESVR